MAPGGCAGPAKPRDGPLGGGGGAGDPDSFCCHSINCETYASAEPAPPPRRPIIGQPWRRRASTRVPWVRAGRGVTFTHRGLGRRTRPWPAPADTHHSVYARRRRNWRGHQRRRQPVPTTPSPLPGLTGPREAAGGLGKACGAGCPAPPLLARLRTRAFHAYSPFHN